MKKILTLIFTFFIFYIFCAVIPQQVFAQNQTPLKSITGTFLFPDFAITDQNTMDTFLDGIKALGLDTVIWNYSGTVIYKSDCTGVETTENYFTENQGNFLVNAERLLSRIHDKGLSVFVGLAGIWRCDNVFWGGDPNNPNSYPGRTIEQSKQLISGLQKLCQNKGWDCGANSFIKGFYVPPEKSVGSLSSNSGFYSKLSTAVKTLEPNKKILISPYLLDGEDYQAVYNNIYYAVQNLGVDIIAPQDGVGAGNVTTFSRSKEHYQALSKAIQDANTTFGKEVKAWANIETFSPSRDGGKTFPPANFTTLKWQLQAADGFVAKNITWLYSWSFANDPILANNGSHYTPAYAERRKQLRSDYIANILNPATNLTPTPTSTPPPISTPTPTVLPGDFNHDNKVNVIDFALFMNYWFFKSKEGDLNGDGQVSVIDYTVFMNYWYAYSQAPR